MKILITGATGFIGGHLSRKLSQEGHTIVALSRDADLARLRVPEIGQAFNWQPMDELPRREAFEGVDAVVNLLGETVQGRWTASKKRLMWDSRIVSTRNLVEAIGKLDTKPKVLVSASAIGYYGDRGENNLTEDSSKGTGFLSDMCIEWENEANKAAEFGLHVATIRTGIVLGADGGAMPPLVRQFKFGIGGSLGSGRQWWPWVHIDDVVGIYTYALENELSGPLNNTAPEPVRQKDLAKALGRVLRRPAIMPAPSFTLKIALGEFASELLFSRRVLPERTQQVGYAFKFSDLDAALRDLLSKDK